MKFSFRDVEKIRFCKVLIFNWLFHLFTSSLTYVITEGEGIIGPPESWFQLWGRSPTAQTHNSQNFAESPYSHIISKNLPDSLDTLHLNRKYLSNNSSWDFDTVLDTINPNWFYPDEYFCPQSSGSRWCCNSLKQLFKKELQMKIGHHFQAKKTSATPKFCKRNFSRMHHVGDMSFLSLIVPMLEVQKNLVPELWEQQFLSGRNWYGSIVSRILSKSQWELFLIYIFP